MARIVVTSSGLSDPMIWIHLLSADDGHKAVVTWRWTPRHGWLDPISPVPINGRWT